jgi:DHA2 family multidrug resistance protein
MLLVGGVLNSSTVLQPQFSQELLGYTATVAGKALTAGGLILILIAPLSGIASDKFSARNLAFVGFAFFAFAFYYSSTHVTLTMSFGFSSWLRILQVAPIPLCFIAITNAAYMGLPKEASNQVSGIINFARNVGGSIFISVTGAVVTNRTLFHENRLADHMQASNPVYTQRLDALTRAYAGVTGGQGAAAMARGQIYNQLNRQASAMGYGDVYRLLFWMSVVMIFLALLLSKNKPGEGAPVGEGAG